VLAQAVQARSCPGPIASSFSCDSLAANAKRKNRFVTGAEAASHGIPAGSLFLVRRTSQDWTHTGIVVNAQRDTFETIEGNTNDAGDREGYEVCRRIRSYASKDFIRVD
jgi:hypothetical protein